MNRLEEWALRRRPTKVIKSIAMTPAEAEGYRRMLSFTANTRQSLSTLLLDLLEDLNERIEHGWDEVAQRFDYPNLAAVHSERRQLRIDHVMREIQLLEYVGEPLQEKPDERHQNKTDDGVGEE